MQVTAAMHGHLTVYLLTCLIVLQTTFDTSNCFRLSAAAGSQRDGVQAGDIESDQVATNARAATASKSLLSLVNPKVYHHSLVRRSPTFRLGKRSSSALDTLRDDFVDEQDFESKLQYPFGSSEDEEAGPYYGDLDDARLSITERSSPTFRLGKRGPTFRLGKRASPTFRLGRRSARGILGYDSQVDNDEVAAAFRRIRKGQPTFRLGRRSVANDDFDSNDVIVLPYYFRDLYAVERGDEPKAV